MTEVVSIPTSSRKGRRYPVPEQGMYGKGMPIEADVFLWEVRESEYSPGYDKEGKYSPYWQFSFKIIPEEGPMYFVRDLQSFTPGSGSKAILWLETAKVPSGVAEVDGEECKQFDLQQAAPREIGGIEMGAPWTDPNDSENRRHGKIIAVIGKE